MKKLKWLLILLLMMVCCAPEARAVEAEDLSHKSIVTAHSGFSSPSRLFDGIFLNPLSIKSGGSMTLSHEGGIGSLYILFDLEPGIYTVISDSTGESHTFGHNGYLHEFLDLEAAFGEAPVSVTVCFDNGPASINELYVYAPGDVPDSVQKWAPPVEGEADLVLFSTHGDDEQLFFAGLLPYYAGEMGYNVQVVYLTDHRNMTNQRVPEMLNGLWAVGLRNYPVLGTFGDYQSESLAEAEKRYRDKGIGQEDVLRFVVENIRRFRPKVAVGHDLNGEYGHGMHMLYADALCKAVEISGKPEVFPELAEKYGVWDVPKTYLHLYPQNQVRLDWDIPLDSFQGMTAFEVTKELGFPCHVTQQRYYGWYFSGMEKASDIPQYSPCEYGLYRSTVGADRNKDDLFEHMSTHAQDALQEAQRQAEEAARQTEEAARQETAVETAAQEPQKPQSLPQQDLAKRENTLWMETLLPIAAGALLLALAAAITKRGNRKK